MWLFFLLVHFNVCLDAWLVGNTLWSINPIFTFIFKISNINLWLFSCWSTNWILNSLLLTKIHIFFQQIFYFYFLLPISRENIVWGSNFRNGYLMGLHVLRYRESENHIFSVWSVCMCVCVSVCVSVCMSICVSVCLWSP